MPPRRRSESLPQTTPRAPARTPGERENQLVSMAWDVAEKQLRDGTASAAVILQLLKYGSSRERLEQKKLELEGGLLATKRELLESEKRTELMIRDALHAMRSYQGIEEPEGGMVVEHRDTYDED